MFASSQLTLVTGRSSRPQPLSSAFGQAPAATQVSHSAKVTAVLLTANGCPIVTSRCGPSSLLRSFSFTGEPIANLPAGTTIIVGQPFAHSLNSDPGFAAFSFSCWAVRT